MVTGSSLPPHAGMTPPRPLIDAVHDRRLVGAIEPDLVGQVGRADLAIALALRPVANGAIVGEDFSPLGSGAIASGRSGHGAHVIGDGRRFASGFSMPSRPNAGMTIPCWPSSSPERAPWVMVCWMSASVPPHSQSLSSRFG